MELKILNSILFKELMPWAFDAKGMKSINEKIKKVGSKAPTTEAELIQQLQILLVNYSDLSKWLTKQNTKSASTLKNHCYTIDFPTYGDAISKFYNLIISLETLRVYNAFNTKIQKYNKKIDIVYNTTIALKNLKALTVNTVKEIKEKGFEEAPAEASSLPHFVLQLLRQHLTILFFDIQELSKASLDNPTGIEDFYMVDLGLPKGLTNELKKIAVNTNEEVKSIAQSNNKAFSFGFKGDEVKLRNVVSVLCTHKNLLDETITKTADLIKLLTTKDINDKVYKIQIGCETNLFQYIVDKLKVTLPKLNYANIGRCKYFFTKNGKPIQASLLSNSKSNNPLSKQTREDIDKVFKENDM